MNQGPTRSSGPRLLLSGGHAEGGSRLDVAIDPSTGLIVATAAEISTAPGDDVLDCAGMVVLAAPAEPHAHLDKALSGTAAPNPSGDLASAIAAWHAYWPNLTRDDIVDRATSAVEQMVLHGTTAIRSHVDIGVGVGLTAVRALLEVRDDLQARGIADLQLVALISMPLTGEDGREHRRLLDEALDLGIDVVGGSPWRDPNPVECTDLIVAAATRRGLAIDVHTDETIDVEARTLGYLVGVAGELGLAGRVTASHCVSLGMQGGELQRDIAAAMAAAGVAAVTLPQTNLSLQARGLRIAPPRGLTAVRTMLEAGVTVAAGADNVRDPYCAVGRLDAFETAGLLVVAAHLSVEEAWAACTTGARRALGLPAGGVAPGSRADILLAEGATLQDAMAAASEQRIVIHAGRVVARSRVERWLATTDHPAR